MTSPVDAKALGKLRRIAPNLLAARQRPDDWQPRPLPEEICFKLTNRCDLRCRHCYHWGPQGYHHRLPRASGGRDLPLDIVAKLLAATRVLRANVFLWGGEPLLYRDWDGLVELLAADPRWTTICTNGTWIERRLPSLLGISGKLELSVSLDGFAAEHDALRGAGAFARTFAGIAALVRSKRAGSYAGEISVNCVVSDAMVDRLFDFVATLEAEGVEALYLSLPWFISAAAGHAMEGYLAAHLPELAGSPRPSWQSFGFTLSPGRVERLAQELARVRQASWRLKLRENPKLAPAELPAFFAGSCRPAQNKTRCLALRTRLDVFPNGDVVACKFFPEFVMGNLTRASLPEIWHGQAFQRLRETIAHAGVMPVCARCNLLYARGS
jgi:radical SAM protein with 4Fe4S-binding SPASM domain